MIKIYFDYFLIYFIYFKINLFNKLKYKIYELKCFDKIKNHNVILQKSECLFKYLSYVMMIITICNNDYYKI